MLEIHVRGAEIEVEQLGEVEEDRHESDRIDPEIREQQGLQGQIIGGPQVLLESLDDDRRHIGMSSLGGLRHLTLFSRPGACPDRSPAAAAGAR